MTLKSILVHLADDEDHALRLRAAARLAHDNQAFLRALFLTRPAHMPAGVTGRGASRVFLEEAQDRARAKSDTRKAEFSSRCGEVGIDHEWLVEDGEHLEELARHAHLADLVVVSRSAERDFEGRLNLSLAEGLTIAAGSPVLVLPPKFSDAGEVKIGKHAMIAWRENREAVRAVRDSLPLLQQADRVSVVSVNDHKGEQGVMPEEVIDFLARHGVKAEAELIDNGPHGVGDTLLDHQQNIGADLLISGAYGHSSAREILFGGVSRTLFTHHETPILVSH